MKHTLRREDVKKRIIHRLKIARGHMDKVIEMTEKDEYCIDIVHQTLAVSSALKKASELTLENHLSTCVANSMKDENRKELIDELMSILKKS